MSYTVYVETDIVKQVAYAAVTYGTARVTLSLNPIDEPRAELSLTPGQARALAAELVRAADCVRKGGEK